MNVHVYIPPFCCKCNSSTSSSSPSGIVQSNQPVVCVISLSVWSLRHSLCLDAVANPSNKMQKVCWFNDSLLPFSPCKLPSFDLQQLECSEHGLDSSIGTERKIICACMVRALRRRRRWRRSRMSDTHDVRQQCITSEEPRIIQSPYFKVAILVNINTKFLSYGYESQLPTFFFFLFSFLMFIDMLSNSDSP